METNKRSYGPFRTVGHVCCGCRPGYSVKVPKNKNFNDWFNAEHVLWSEPATVSDNAFVAIAGFQSEDCQSTSSTVMDSVSGIITTNFDCQTLAAKVTP